MKVDKDGPVIRPELGPCWLWTARRNKQGYGQFKLTGGKNYMAHRFAYDLAHPDDPLGNRLGLHHCDNPPCVNPTHVFPGDYAVNAADRNAKGRQAKGPQLGQHNAIKTHCPQGHPYDAGNLYLTPDGKRQCRACIREAVRRYREKKALRA